MVALTENKISLFEYIRRESRVVNIGDVPLGGNYPIRVQSMTTTDTMDTEKTVAQSIRMIEAGCEYVRITAPSLKEAENLRNIKAELRKRGYNAPLIADIHFTPNAAELAARIVEKVRINPGNYVDKKKFEVKEYSDIQYEAEMDRIRQRFSPLVKICKEYGTAMRIGTNHGSLSDRIMNRYGDSPEGMVESAMEFLRICEELDYHSIVLSMKSSNPIVMIQAYRQLVEQMDKEGMNYPLHLGVTEAGENEEGRIKSALGIGTLLEEGIGDTIRVSLTEEPEYEIPVAKALISKFQIPNSKKISNSKFQIPSATADISNQSNQSNQPILNIGGHNVPRVIADFSGLSGINQLSLKAIDYHYDAITDKWNMGEQGADYIYFGNGEPGFMLPNGTKGIYDYSTWLSLTDKINNYPLLSLEEYENSDLEESHFININIDQELNFAQTLKIKKDKNAILVISTTNLHTHKSIRSFINFLQVNEINNPIILRRNYSGTISEEEFVLYSATDIGGLLAENIGNGIWLSYDEEELPTYKKLATQKMINRTAFNILQAARKRISKTEYISCPSCGRTLFDLQQTTAMIRQKTDHLKGVKIAIMGCIVNGPGEMADADYGYVGTGPGKITLYRNKEVFKKNIDSKFALDELINLIKIDGHWIDNQYII